MSMTTPDSEPVTPPEGLPAASRHRVADYGTAVGIIGFDDDDRLRRGIFLLAFLLALGIHAVLGVGFNQAPQKKMAERIEMAVYVPPPPPPPEPPPPPPEPEKPKPKPPPQELKPPPPTPEPPPPPPPSNDTPPEPPSEPVPIVTGINLNSVVQGSGGPTVRVGNTTYGDPNSEKFVPPSEVKSYAGGSPGFKAAKTSSITKEADVICRTKPRFPKELADQGIEGVTELLLKIASTGELVEARVSRSSGHKVLDDLSLQGIRSCAFKPGEVNGEAVDTLLRYKFRWEVFD
jgi:protein TonB